MSLISELARQFSSGVRQRGREYFQDGSVESVRRDGDELRTRVQGTRRYDVRIDLSNPDEPQITCSCPFAKDRLEPCKHAWAAILQAANMGLLNGATQDNEPDEDGSEDDEPPRPTGWRPIRRRPAPTKSSTPTWKRQIHQLRDTLGAARLGEERVGSWPAGKRVVYTVDLESTLQDGRGLMVEVCTQAPGKTPGQWLAAKRLTLDELDWLAVPDEADRRIANLLIGASAYYNSYYPSNGAKRFQIHAHAYDVTLRAICETHRCFLRRQRRETKLEGPLNWDDGPPWEFALDVRPDGELVHVAGKLTRPSGDDRDAQVMQLSEPDLLLAEGLLIAEGAIARFRHHGAWAVVGALRGGMQLKAPVQKAAEVVRELYALPRLPPVSIPPEVGLSEVSAHPKPKLRVAKSRGASARDDRLVANLSFDYDGHVIASEAPQAAIFDEPNKRIVRRDREAEAAASRLLLDLGFRHEWDGGWGNSRAKLQLPAHKLPGAVARLTVEGWQVEADGKLYRRAGKLDVRVSSGIDWFELNASVDFDGQRVALPRLLAALKKGETSVILDDGTLGVLPDEWLKKYAPLAALGEEQDDDPDVLHFSPAQVGFLDVLLAEMPEAQCDEQFERARKALREFEGVEASDAPQTFVGELRPYQRDGLGWLKFLQQFSFGGCLADDMGLGKTVQVLALLDDRRAQKAGTSLVVVPRSLVFNWISEAAKFTPQLRVLDHSGALRKKSAEHFEQYDVILTTYGTLRRDAGYFKDVTFDYVILDESQAIKNAGTESAKATRLLRGRHRLAMSGTPIENHLGELWSLFEFLNPGMMGASDTLKVLTTAVNERAARAKNGDGEDEDRHDHRQDQLDSRRLLARALRPFILRRTKQQVASDLPEKLEQTIFCELEPAQRKLYDELRDHYRQSLFDRIAEVGLNKAKIHVLEALLRLRQAACHPGLIDKARSGENSAKLDTLLDQITEVVEEGHKVLVFSQFTSMLAIVKQRLDKDNRAYEYLDGQTRDRQRRVERFQSDPDCKLFLISLKAGGLGLNLTAADYVYLLDPWWNPAVEAQAIDRAHRIGQDKRVFAYRLIARNTVEEKVLELQRTKRDLADAIINADNSMIASLGKEEIELLLS